MFFFKFNKKKYTSSLPPHVTHPRMQCYSFVMQFKILLLVIVFEETTGKKLLYGWYIERLPQYKALIYTTPRSFTTE